MNYLKLSMRFNVRFFPFFIFSFLLPVLVVAQSSFSITGSVIEKDTNEPIAAAQVFLNGTTIGTTSNENGDFILSGIPEGIYDLSVSLLGFEQGAVTINTASLEATYNFVLTPKVYELEEVTVRPDLEQWKINFEEFRKNFIGTGPFSKNTKILNSEVLSFDFDPYERTLKATAYDKLIIENKDLGYLITYYLDYFEINYKGNSSVFYGRPFFEKDTSNRKRTRNKWEQNRALAYYGSFLHFSRTLIENNAVDQGYMSRGEKREEGARYVSDGTISESIYFFPVDSSTYMFSFINFINVTYENEKEDKTYLQYIWNNLSRNNRTITVPQNSSFTLTQDSVLIDKSGYIFNPVAVILDGYWSFERVSDMMPLDYTPKKNEEE